MDDMQDIMTHEYVQALLAYLFFSLRTIYDNNNNICTSFSEYTCQ